ncbi:hypothetical protein MPSI1_000003 [Malassezia psittaci]|uniref:Uncharacterized protein n=1 Tax=Malassezia psittaci TaxID=1821823 RepID=A0AAF0FAP4_9BASI|nr:hypothetical protein MPSI1_000003 [Malassezia psittaci]
MAEMPADDQVSRIGLLKKFFFLDLVALQFGIDSTLWLATAYSYIATLVPSDLTNHYLSIAQLLPSGVQFFVSLLVGPTIAYFGCGMKWPMVAFILCSAIGNFLYSCSGLHGIGNVWGLIGGRMLSGLASGSSSLSMTYIVNSSSTAERLEALSQYRTMAGFAMVLGPALSIPLTIFAFSIGKFEVNGNNAPTFVSAGIALLIAIITAIAVHDMRAKKLNFFDVMIRNRDEILKGESVLWQVPTLSLILLFVSSFLMADCLFLMSNLMRSETNWDLSLTLISGLQAVVFLVALFGSLCTDVIRKGLGRWTERLNEKYYLPADLGEVEDKAKTQALTKKIVPELLLSASSFLGSIIGSVLIIVSLAVLNGHQSGKAGSLACFLLGCCVMMTAYNMQAASLPSLYSKSLPINLRTVLTPWYGATVALGKLVAPPVIAVIGGATRSNNGFIGGQGLCIGVALIACISVCLSMRPFVKAIALSN